MRERVYTYILKFNLLSIITRIYLDNSDNYRRQYSSFRNHLDTIRNQNFNKTKT